MKISAQKQGKSTSLLWCVGGWGGVGRVSLEEVLLQATNYLMSTVH